MRPSSTGKKSGHQVVCWSENRMLNWHILFKNVGFLDNTGKKSLLFQLSCHISYLYISDESVEIIVSSIEHLV